MTKWKIYNEDAVEWAKNYQKGKFHALLCDAPYHLTSIVKRFGKAKESDNTQTSEKVRNRSDGYGRLIGTGFMGNTWDGGDLAFRPETWEAFGQVLHPGAFGMAFSASRNWHRMAVAIEDAGFILHPTIFLWAYGQGFPKATNIDKKIKNGVFEGHRYGLQALKPAVEPIIVFQKPYENRPLDDIMSTGAGALNIDGGRIPLANGDEYSINEYEDGMKPFGNGAGHSYKSKKIKTDKNNWKPQGYKLKNSIYEFGTETVKTEQSPLGRWPSNLLLTESSAESLDRQTGILTSGKPQGIKKAQNNIYGEYGTGLPVTGIGDSGGASRFFYSVQERLDENDPVYYCGKVSPKERQAGLDDRNIHPTLKPIDLCRYLATILLPPAEYAPRRLFIPFSGVGSEMIGAGLAGWEQICGVEFDTENGYVDIAEKRLQHWLGEKK